MGTLTADCPRLDTHCPHKLATSCRLTSTPQCCACADERPHSRLYRVYIDGVGFVQRGTRWQSYCWFCKEFWNNRLAATDPPLEASQTQIPLIPDQTEFLERWFEFHQGYRTARASDGTQSRIAVIGEPLREVSPGFLPRTLAQLRAGRANDASRPENRTRQQRLTSEEERPEDTQQSIEDALDELLADASHDEEQQEQAGDMPLPLSPPLSRHELRIRQARNNIMRVFGSREDVQRDDYESPLSTIFNRAESRYQQAEERRANGDTAAPPTENMTARERREVEEQILWGVMDESTTMPSARDPDESFLERLLRRASPTQPSESLESSSDSYISRLQVDVSRLRDDLFFAQPPPSGSSDLAPISTAMPTSASNFLERIRRLQAGPRQTLDAPDRPDPLSDEQMTKNLACQVCYVQIADIAILPCGHMCMCKWCADVVVPVKHSTFPARPSQCPMCRKGVKQRVKIHVGG